MCVADYPMYRGVSRLLGMDILPRAGGMKQRFQALQSCYGDDYNLYFLHLTLPSLKAWGFSLLRESLESTELNPDTFPDLKTASYLEVIRSQGFLKEGA